jgi:dTDP-4-dehydrorhamnose 3,5-epimerase
MIEGVIIKKIVTHKDSRGFFREIFKTKNNSKNQRFRQISHSLIKKNIIKGWHLHKKQCQWNYLLKGNIKVYLYDTREKSKTFKKHQIIKINSKTNSIIYFFPPGVGHGYITLANENHMIYATSGIYDPNEEYKMAHINNSSISNFFKINSK